MYIFVLIAQDEIVVAFKILGNLVGQDRICIQIGHLYHGDDTVFGMIQQKVGLAGIIQGKQFDHPLVDIVICDAGRNGKAAGSQEAFVKIEGFQSCFCKRADTGVGFLLDGTADQDTGNLQIDELVDMGNSVGNNGDIFSCQKRDHQVSG